MNEPWGIIARVSAHRSSPSLPVADGRPSGSRPTRPPQPPGPSGAPADPARHAPRPLGVVGRRGGAANGLFHLLGVDFSHYWAMWAVYRTGKPAAMYDLRSLEPSRRHVLDLYSPRHYRRVSECGTPYPPIYGALLAPFSIGPPHRAFAVWTLLQLCLALLARRAASFLPRHRRGSGSPSCSRAIPSSTDSSWDRCSS